MKLKKMLASILVSSSVLVSFSNQVLANDEHKCYELVNREKQDVLKFDDHIKVAYTLDGINYSQFNDELPLLDNLKGIRLMVDSGYEVKGFITTDDGVNHELINNEFISDTNHIKNVELQLAKKEETKDEVSKVNEVVASNEKVELNEVVNLPLNIDGSYHTQMVGWKDHIDASQTLGVVGRGLRLEAIKLNLNADLLKHGNLKVSMHVSNVGWMNYKNSNEVLGTTGKGQAIEAFKMQLVGDLAKNYNVNYRVYARGLGWLDWASNDELAGSTGCSRPLEGVQVVLTPKDQLLNQGGSASSTLKYEVPRPVFNYQSHVQNIGWQNKVSTPSTSGTEGQALRMEAFVLSDLPVDVTSKGNVLYQSHVQNVGWQNYVSQNNISGTTGRSLRVEGMRFKLTNDLAKEYNIYARGHVEGIGWLGWGIQGQLIGSEGCSRRLEAIQVMIVPKSGVQPQTSKSYTTKPKEYSDNYYKQFLMNQHHYGYASGISIDEAGCGPVSITMALNIKHNNPKYISPYKVATTLKNTGLWTRDGMFANKTRLPKVLREHFGFEAQYIGTNPKDLLNHLRSGGMVLMCGSGYKPFTWTGHFLLAVKARGNDVMILDSNTGKSLWINAYTLAKNGSCGVSDEGFRMFALR